MKVLWITNVLFPDVCNELKISVPVIAGWVHSGAKALLNEDKTIELGVATLYHGKAFQAMQLNGIKYFLIPTIGRNHKYESKLEQHWKNIHAEFKPDVVHIHGTEYPHGKAYILACGNKNVVVSIQGLVSICERYYYGGISKLKLLKNVTPRDIVRIDSIFNQRAEMHHRGILEKKTIKMIDHIIGRTSWDKAHVKDINPDINYHFCNETLRDVFFKHKWELENCEKYSIFLSQAYYPLKGLQQLIKALPIIIRHYPQTKVYVAGQNFFTNRGWRLHGFGKYIHSLIKEYGVEDYIIFTGVLTELDMCNRYNNSHVFVCPSSIENSSNSIGEAQVLGVPCVASYVGGVSDLIKDYETGILYRFEESEMLADVICKIFADDTLANKLSENGKKVASIRHNSVVNARQLSSIYKDIISV